MTVRSSKTSLFYTGLIILGLLLSACSQVVPAPVLEAGTYLVDPIFREFYASLGGREILGPPITVVFTHRGKQCQYTQNALMCFDPMAEGLDRFVLQGIGKSLGVSEDPGGTASDGLIIDGYPIYEEFEPLYHRLYGALYVGKPLTQPRYNASKNRIEQYFENVGFYRNLDDQPGDVYLLSYGVFTCSSDCRFPAPASAQVVTNVSSVEQPFLSRIARLGGLTIFGIPLTDPYQGSDGAMEQVYETVVLYSPPNTPGGVRLRPIANLLEMPSVAPMPPIYSESDGVVFYSVQGDLGYHVPVIFDHFIARHGGLEISGHPLADVIQVDANLYRQCFENYCLIYDNNPGASPQVRMAPLGHEYMRKFALQPAKAATFLITPETIHLVAHPALPRIPSDQPQQFLVTVVRTHDQQPAAGLETSLTLTLPDGNQALYRMPATDSRGRTSLTIAPFQPPLSKGSVVAFEVCLNVPSESPICSSDSYLIWNFR